MKHPPIAPLHALIERFERAGIEVALGGSGLLAALGLADHVRDWDLTTDATQAEIEALVQDLAPELAGPSGVHADHKVMLPSIDSEVICRFALHVERGVVRIPTVVTGRWQGTPVGSAEAWAVAYALMDRAEKSVRLFAWLETQGGNDAALARLRAEPLPEPLARRLAGITSRNA